jgi:hypothetical protein
MYCGVMPLAVYDRAVVTDSSAMPAPVLVIHLGESKFNPKPTYGAKTLLPLPKFYGAG